MSEITQSGGIVFIAMFILSYIMGSIPTGLWLGLRLRGIDIREHGSRNIGATNTLRTLGKGLGAAALLGDMLKGLIPVLAARYIGDDLVLPVACGVAAILGHTFSLFLKLQGGKGVATSTGVFLGLLPLATLIAAGVFALVVALTRMVSAASLSAAVALVVAVLFLRPDSYLLQIMAVAMAGLVFLRHRENMVRILAGTESRIGGSKRPAPDDGHTGG